MATRGRGARIKGATFERHIAKIMTEATGSTFQRGLGQTRKGGAEVADVHSEHHPRVHIECKRQIKCNIKAAMQQALDDIEGSTKTPIVITKDDNEDTLVTMRLEDWLVLLQSAISRESVWPTFS
jgi:hypothetical protein